MCPGNDLCVKELGAKLSSTAQIYFPGSDEFDLASTRWSVLEGPKVNVVVVPGTENDVAETVKFANKKQLPFLAYNGAHGAITTLSQMEKGIEIYLNQISSFKITKNRNTTMISGEIISKTVTDKL